MEIRTLYRYIREEGGVTVSPTAPESDVQFTEMFRIVAGDGKLVTFDGKDKYAVIDVDSCVGWYEVDDTEIGADMPPAED